MNLVSLRVNITWLWCKTTWKSAERQAVLQAKGAHVNDLVCLTVLAHYAAAAAAAACQLNRVCKYNVSDDEISRILAIIHYYGNQRLSTVRSGLGKMTLSICYWSNYRSTNNKANLLCLPRPMNLNGDNTQSCQTHTNVSNQLVTSPCVPTLTEFVVDLCRLSYTVTE